MIIQKSPILMLGALFLLASCSAKSTLNEAKQVGKTENKSENTSELEKQNSPIKLSEGRTSVQVLLNSQFINYSIHGQYSKSLDELAQNFSNANLSLDLDLSSDNYELQLEQIDSTTHVVKAIAKNEGLLNYAGGIIINAQFKKNGVICESKISTIPTPSWNGTEWLCGTDSKAVQWITSP